MKHLSPTELAAVEVPAPFQPMSRTDKLERWASIVEQAPRPSFFIFNGLESYSLGMLDRAIHPDSAFAAAYNDPVLREAGLAGVSAGDAMRFFELSRSELHEFSCNCGGSISNAEMAKRIRRIGNPGMLEKAMTAIRSAF